jgi:uncharacterized protein
MHKIQNIGEITLVDPGGYIANIARMDNVPGLWKSAIDDVVAGYQRHLGADLLSVYIRGSVVRGTAVAHVSDLDAVAVIKHDLNTADLQWRKSIKMELGQKYNFISKFDLQVVSLNHLLTAPIQLSTRFAIKVQSVCVYGEDVSTQIEPFLLNNNTARGLYESFPSDLEKALAGLKESEDRHLKIRCTWIMKRILRTGFALVMVQERAVTRDLYPSYELFSKHYPPKRDQMYMALEWAINPISDRQTLISYLEDFGRWLSLEVGNSLEF